MPRLKWLVTQLGKELFGRSVPTWVNPACCVLKEVGHNVTTVMLVRADLSVYFTDPGVQIVARGKNQVIRELLARFPRLAGVLVTHSHPDHVGNLPVFLPYLDAESHIYCQAGVGIDRMRHTRDFIPGLDRLACFGRARFHPAPLLRWLTPLYRFYAPLVYGFGVRDWKSESEGGPLAPFPTEPIQLCGGYTLSVSPLPGHCPDEVMMWIQNSSGTERIAIVGDIIPPQDVFRRNLPSCYMPEANLYDVLASLQRLRSLRPTVLIPTHTEFITGEGEINQLLDVLIRTTERMIRRLADLWLEHPYWNAAEVGRAAFLQELGLQPRYRFGDIEMTSYAASIWRDSPSCSLGEP